MSMSQRYLQSGQYTKHPIKPQIVILPGTGNKFKSKEFLKINE